ncbi:MAG TPA: hypothetical protein VND93_27370 [Myxococcales bacterium]|nr:hypothetical protein [Myxococcales bacterium]
MGAPELRVSDEFARWFQWLAAADPPGALELRGAVDSYARHPHAAEEPLLFDLCLSPPPREIAFVVVHVQEARAVVVAAGAEVDGSVQRCLTLLERAEDVVRRLLHGRLEMKGWAEVRRWSREESAMADRGGRG